MFEMFSREYKLEAQKLLLSLVSMSTVQRILLSFPGSTYVTLAFHRRHAGTFNDLYFHRSAFVGDIFRSYPQCPL
jgi:hypothetical protein